MNNFCFKNSINKRGLKQNLFRKRRDRDNHAKEIQYLNGCKGKQLFPILQQKM